MNQAASAANGIPGPRLILLVDDDILIIELLSTFLLRAGYEVRSASSARMALDMIAAGGRAPDLALLDINMPGMSGLELARHLQLETTIPLMFISASAEDEEVDQAASYGAVGYLHKPINATQIAPSVKAALARADDIRDLRETKERLTAALLAGRETSMAVGLLMERYKTDRDTAFQVLRDYARSQRSKLTDVALEVLQSAETLNAFSDRFPGPRK
jgi:CheY-like chemotaxis protein